MDENEKDEKHRDEPLGPRTYLQRLIHMPIELVFDLGDAEDAESFGEPHEPVDLVYPRKPGHSIRVVAIIVEDQIKGDD